MIVPKLEEFNKDNWHLYEKNPESNFSPERNRAIINQTIVEYEKDKFGIAPAVQKAAGDRADILASWAKYKLDIGGGKQLEEWLGRENLARLYGEELCQRIKAMETIKRLNIKNGNSKFSDYYLPES